MKHKPVRTEWERALSRASSHKSYHNRKNKSSRPASAADQTGTPPSLIRDLPPHRALPCPRIAPCHAHVRTRTRWLGARGRARAVGGSRVPWGRAPSTAGSTRLDLAYRTAVRVRVRTAGRARVRMAGRDAGAWQGAMRGQVSDVKPCALCRGGKRVSAAQCSRQQQARCTSICSHDLTLCPSIPCPRVCTLPLSLARAQLRQRVADLEAKLQHVQQQLQHVQQQHESLGIGVQNGTRNHRETMASSIGRGHFWTPRP